MTRSFRSARLFGNTGRDGNDGSRASDEDSVVDQSLSTSMKPHPKGDFVESEELVGQQLFLSDEANGAVLQLNEGAAIVWLLCDGERDVKSIAEEIAGTYSLSEQQVLTQVQEAVAHFQELGLLEP